MINYYKEWCDKHKVTHGHCPFDCEHPQPIALNNKMITDSMYHSPLTYGIIGNRSEEYVLVCGRCLVKNNELAEMIPCTQDICD